MLVLGALPILGVLVNGEIQSQRADVHIKLSNSPRATLPDPRFDLLFLSTAIFSAVGGVVPGKPSRPASIYDRYQRADWFRTTDDTCIMIWSDQQVH